MIAESLHDKGTGEVRLYRPPPFAVPYNTGHPRTAPPQPQRILQRVRHCPSVWDDIATKGLGIIGRNHADTGVHITTHVSQTFNFRHPRADRTGRSALHQHASEGAAPAASAGSCDELALKIRAPFTMATVGDLLRDHAYPSSRSKFSAAVK